MRGDSHVRFGRAAEGNGLVETPVPRPRPTPLTVRIFSSSADQSASSQLPSVTRAAYAVVASWKRERSPHAKARSGPSSGGISNRSAQARAACCSSARFTASHSSFAALSEYRAAFQQSVQSRPPSQRANPARLSAGRSDRSCVISCPQLWTIFHVVRTAMRVSPSRMGELTWCGWWWRGRRWRPGRRPGPSLRRARVRMVSAVAAPAAGRAASTEGRSARAPASAVPAAWPVPTDRISQAYASVVREAGARASTVWKPLVMTRVRNSPGITVRAIAARGPGWASRGTQPRRNRPAVVMSWVVVVPGHARRA